MFDKKELEKILKRIDKKGYKAYKDIQGIYNFGNFVLYIDYVQGDPFASPSRIRIQVPQRIAGFPGYLFSTKERRVGLEDYLTRQLSYRIHSSIKGNRGTGKSGLISVISLGQEILERTSMSVDEKVVEARLSIGLPARGRSVLSREAIDMFFEEIPQLIDKALIHSNLNNKDMEKHVNLSEDQFVLRKRVVEMGLVAFVANGSILPRRSGVDNRKMEANGVVPFTSPEELEVSIKLPYAGEIKGMGIPKGVTLIVGGGYHGKSTLLRAIERGVYNHIPGDGREYVVTSDNAMKVRAEDGRRIEKVNISAFINNLPNGEDTTQFSSDNASGSTSQAANIIEAMEMGTSLILLDEDTSATNFMIRDARMQSLVSKKEEPITPFIDRVSAMYRDFDISTIMVMGGSGDYFDVADRVIMLEKYKPYEVTKKAREIAKEMESKRKREAIGRFPTITRRIPLKKSLLLEGRRDKVKSRGIDSIQYGYTDIVLDDVEQLIDVNQTRAIGDIIKYAMNKYVDGQTTLHDVIKKVERDIQDKGLDIISPYYGMHPGDYARPRGMEIAAAINRLRILKVIQKNK